MLGAVRVFVCTVGIILSFYAYYVEMIKSDDVNYEALCDINEVVSCSAVFSSSYGKGFGLIQHILGEDHILNQPNSVFGVLFFLVQLLGLSKKNQRLSKLLYVLSGIGILGCIYLAYILIYVLKDLCILCVSTYVLTMILHYLNYRAVNSISLKTKKMQ